MTQAFNLSQLANFVNTSGQLNAATGLYNQVPVANGGTGRSSVTSGALVVGAGTSAMTELTGTTPGTIVVSSPTGWTTGPGPSVAGGDYVLQQWTSPNVWTKPANIKAIKVTVIGAGGAGGNATTIGSPNGAVGSGGGGGGVSIQYFDGPALPGPITVTAGPGTNSFGPWNPAAPAPTVTMSATAGSVGASTAAISTGIAVTRGGAGGAGSNGIINGNGQPGMNSWNNAGSVGISGSGGASILGGGALGVIATSNGTAGVSYGSGGGGAARLTGAGAGATNTGGAGAPGIVIVEEFY